MEEVVSDLLFLVFPLRIRAFRDRLPASLSLFCSALYARDRRFCVALVLTSFIRFGFEGHQGRDPSLLPPFLSSAPPSPPPPFRRFVFLLVGLCSARWGPATFLRTLALFYHLGFGSVGYQRRE